jgi:hypothetical protein
MDSLGSGDDVPVPSSRPWRRLDTPYSWPDLVLPEHNLTVLRDLTEQARWAVTSRQDRAFMAVFTGEPGTGKTMAAQIIARSLSLPLIEVDTVAASLDGPAPLAASVWSLLRLTSDERAVLVFDNAGGSLGLGQRGEEESFDLPKRCERSEGGVVIFSSRADVRLTPAESERFAAVVPFPSPAAEARAAIWRRVIAPGASVTDGDIEFLARAFRLHGGEITACAADAAQRARGRGAPLARQDVAAALEAHYARWIPTRETQTALVTLREAADGEALVLAPASPDGLPRPRGWRPWARHPDR